MILITKVANATISRPVLMMTIAVFSLVNTTSYTPEWIGGGKAAPRTH